MKSSIACGLGLRHPHHQALIEQRPNLAFVEVHSENFFGDGGAALAALREVRQWYPLSLHGVGLGLGSAVGLDPWHIERLAALVELVDPVRVSDHASFARALVPGAVDVVHANDLLPIAFTSASLDIMVRHVGQVQDRLKRTIAVENVCSYLTWADDGMPESEFLNELARRSGCRLLVDLNNVVVNAINAGSEPVEAACRWVDAIESDGVEEIHLAGFNDLGDLVIDDHGSRVHPPVWEVYRHAIKRWGRVPTLIEWDNDLPELSVLLEEVGQAQFLMDSCGGAGS